MPDTITAAVPQQTPPQDAILLPAQVYFLSRRLPGIVHLVQYDQSLPYLAVELYEGDEPYTVPDGAAVNFRMAKPVPSTKKVYNPAYGISSDRHTVYIQVTPQMTVVAGCTNPVIEVVVDGGIACTGTLRLEIDPNPVQESDLIDTDEYKTLEEILAEAQAAAQIVQDNEQALQDVHNNLTAIQNAAANAQAAAASAQDAEDAADRAAIESQKALGFRSYFGGQVVPDTNGDLDPSRPMATPTAASVTIKARGDRIAGLTMAGKTTQAGTGDPSPENIRQISGVGQYDQCIVLDGSEDETWAVSSKGGSGPNAYYAQFSLPSGYPGLPFDANTEGNHTASSYVPGVATGNYVVQGNTGICCFTASGNTRLNLSFSGIPSRVSGLRTYLQQHPLTVWYRSVDYAKSTGPFYTVVELSDDPYRAVGFELNQPLFDGDSLKVGGKSGFDQMAVIDGSKDFGVFSTSGASNRLALNQYISPSDVQIPSDNYTPGKIASSRYPARSAIDTYSSIVGIGVQGSGDGKGTVFLFDPTLQTNEAAKAYFQSHPLIVFYKSVDYTPEADIAVALEKHVMGFKVVTGTETIAQDSSGTTDGYDSVYTVPCLNPVRDTLNLVCSQYEAANTAPNSGNIGVRTAAGSDSLIFEDAKNLTSLAATKSYFAAQYAAGTPVQVVYELATPASYARPVPTMIAQPGEDGTFTVTGENSLSVLLKAFQDGGDAATIEGHTWADILAAIQAATASTANALLEEKTNV